MKKILTILCAAALIAGLAACGKDAGSEGNSASSQSAATDRVVYDEPEGYEKVAQGNTQALYTIENEAGEVTHDIKITTIEATDEYKKGLTSNDRAVLEEELATEFEDNLTVTFTTIGICTGIRIDDSENIETTYILLAGDWVVMVNCVDSDQNMEKVNADMQSLIESIRLESLTFGG